MDYDVGLGVLRMRFVKFACCLPLICAAVLPANANSSPAKDRYFQLGDRLPPLKVTQVFQGFPETTIQWNNLRGKVVVLEFWATWCVPCVNEIPHLNKLADDLSSEPVVFMSVTVGDEPERVSEFLKTTKVSGWVASAMPEVREEFAIFSYPQTYVLDKNGRLAAITLPEFLNTEVMHRILAGKPADVPVKDISAADLDWDRDSADSLHTVLPSHELDYEVLVERTTRENCGASLPTEGGNFIADGCDAQFLISSAYQADVFNVIFPQGITSSHFRVAVRIPRGSTAEVFAAAQQAISSALGVRVRWEIQNREVYVLQQSSETGLMLKPSKSSPYSGLRQTEDGLEATGDTGLQGFCQEFIEPKLAAIVVNEAHTSGTYDWRIKRDTELKAVVERDLGLKLVQAVRPVKMLIVELQEPTKP
jgi:thiol-disulfide isomerase/thioredoxin